MRYLIRIIYLIICLLIATLAGQAQDIKIGFGKARLPIEEYFTVSVKLQNQTLKGTLDFPELEGFKKSNRFRSIQNIRIRNKLIKEETITQNYAALKEGTFNIKSFNLLVNGKVITSKNILVTVGPIAKASPGIITDTSQLSTILAPPKQSDDKKFESYLSLESDKKTIFNGEGVTINLAFYLADSEQGLLDFYEFANQFPKINRGLNQKNAWLERNPQTEFKPDTVIINKKQFIKYTLFEAAFYPLQINPLTFPAVSLIMLAQNKDASYLLEESDNKELKTFTAKPLTIIVKPLPTHPLENNTAVGNFKVQEGINRTNFKTGQSFTYWFELTGNGNLATVMLPEVVSNKDITIYPPIIKETKQWENGQLICRKRFTYTILANTPGIYRLKKYFRIPIFNPATAQYEIKQSDLEIKIKGPADNKTRKPEETDSFYKLINEADSTLVNLNPLADIKMYTNLVLLFLICAALYLFLKK